MISWRRYFAILMIFLAVLLLFQGLQLGRIYMSEIHVNKHISQAGLKASDVRQIHPLIEFGAADGADPIAGEPYILYIGKLDSPYLETIKEWAVYTDQKIYHTETFTVTDSATLPQLILLSPQCIAGNADVLDWYTTQGVNVICLALPDVQVIENDPLLQRLLGILEVRRQQVELSGLHLFAGFFLGGERIYCAEYDGDPRQDLQLTVPWYVTRELTKTFMRGILSETEQRIADEDKLENEDMPSILWSSHANRGEIFVICGDFFSYRKIALGILAAARFEYSDYSLYPVVNAQVLSMIDYPIAADENDEQMHKVYGRELTKFESDIVVPQLQSLASRYGFCSTCFMGAKYDYDDEASTKAAFIHHYLGILHDTEGELGLTTRFTGSVSLQQKLDNDARFYLSEGSEYPVHGAFVSQERLAEVLKYLPQHPVWQSIHTFSLSPAEDLPILGYLTEEISLQQVTSDAMTHTFRQDLELLGLQTALGYDNIGLCMSDVFWPKTSEQEWQNASRTAFESISTYYAPFSAFDRVTISESDARVRGYLSRRYTLRREGDTLFLQLPEWDDTASFLLRTHNEEILSVTGAAYTLFEEDTYLIIPTEEHVEIRLFSQLAKLLHPEVGH